MAISKKNALEVLEWFKDELNDSIDTKLATVTGGNGDENVIEAISIDGKNQTVTNKTARLDLSGYVKTSDLSPYATTNEVNQKLATITGGGEDNVIESISIDGTPQPVINKNVNLSLSGFATKTEINNVLHSISSLSWAINSISNYTIVVEGGESLKPATTTELGGVIVGEGLSITNKGVLSANPVVAEVEMPIASKTELGGIIAGAGLSIKDDGTLSVIPPESVGEFFLTPATRYDLGGVIVGNGLFITDEGVLSVTDTGDGIENISIDGKAQSVANKTATLDLSGYAKKTEVGSGVRMKGSVNSYTDLPTTALTGDLYNIKQAGGSDGTGIAIKAGDNVVYTDNGTWDVMAGFVDTSDFITKSDFTDELKEKLAGLSNFVLSAATTEKLGGVIVGSGLSITKEGVLSAETTGFFIGATATDDGKSGIVPAPNAGEENKFLRGDGYWARFPTQSINLLGGGSGAVIIDAFSYPPNHQGALWMDVVDDEYVLKLRHGDYEYIFQPDLFSPATINPPPADLAVTGEIYYLNTVPSTVNGGMWYTVDSNQHPTLWVYRKGSAYEYNFGYTYDMIAYKGTQEYLYSYLFIRPNFMRDLLEQTWTTNITSPAIEQIDSECYALRNVDKSLTTYSTNSGWTHEVTQTVVYYGSNVSTYRTRAGRADFTIDFWLSWKEDTSAQTTAVFADGDVLAPILQLGTWQASGVNLYTNKSLTFAILNTSFVVRAVGGTTTTAQSTATISGTEALLEENPNKRVHVAITHKKGGKALIYLDGKCVMETPYNFTAMNSVKIFPYCVGEQSNYRGLYIDHFRIWDTALWDDPDNKDFEPPKPEDYIIW